MGRTHKLAILAAAAMFVAGAALADVKGGVDAWTRGDYAAAVKAWEAPAASGDADAMFNLAQAYKLGRGVPQDLSKAERLYTTAAGKGHLQAADSLGLLLFQRGERARALPYLSAASDRGDPRAQYLLGIAHFNGDGVPKDWVRAYALVNLAQQGGVEAAKPALAQMDKYVPIEQRQQAVQLTGELAAQAQARRASQLAAADLGTTIPSANTPRIAATTALPLPLPTLVTAGRAVSVAACAAACASPRTAGADYTRPTAAPTLAATPTRPVAMVEPPRVPVTAAPGSPIGGVWKIQLGAFGVAANADALWARVRARPEVAGHARINARAGAVTKLQAGGYPSQAAALAACRGLSSGGFTCIATR